jgi:hypothetical protein
LRFGIGGTLTYGRVNSENPRVIAGAFSPGLVVDMGVQLGDYTALYFHGKLNTLFTSSEDATYVIAEWTPVHWFSLGTGIGVDHMVAPPICYPTTGCIRSTWFGFSFPLTLGLNIGERPDFLARRGVFRIGLEGAAGIEPGTSVLGIHATTALSFTLM